MSQIYRNIRIYISTLQPRDQRALIWLAGFLALLFLWLGVWRPMEATLKQSAASYRTESIAYAWMQSHAQQVQNAESNATTSDQAPLLTVATDTAATYHITIGHAEPSGDGALALTLEHVAFSELLQWLEAMQHEHGVTVIQMTMQRMDSAPGYVNAALTLQRK